MRIDSFALSLWATIGTVADGAGSSSESSGDRPEARVSGLSTGFGTSLDAKGLKLGSVRVGAESGWSTANTQSIEFEAEKRGIDLKFANAPQKQENQTKSIRSFIARTTDVIAFSPVIETGWTPVQQEAR